MRQAQAAQRSFFLAIALMLVSIALAGFTGFYVRKRVIRPLKRDHRRRDLHRGRRSGGADSV